MTVTQIENTHQLPGKSPLLCVYCKAEDEALAELEHIAQQRGYVLEGPVYRYGAAYYYAPVKKAQGA